MQCIYIWTFHFLNKLQKNWTWSRYPIFFRCTCVYIYIYIYIYIYSGYGKYSDPLKFFTLCYIAAICWNHLSSFFFLINVHTAPHIDRKTQNCWHFCRFIKKEKLKYHMVLSIQTLCCDTHIFNSGAVHFFWSSLRWFYTFIWVQLCLIILIGLD